MKAINYLFKPSLVYELNLVFNKCSLSGFFINSGKLHQDSKKLNTEYFMGYLSYLAYRTYLELFKLDKLVKENDIRYWYNSNLGSGFVRMDRKLWKHGLNPLRFISYRMSCFYYQRERYGRPYDYRLPEFCADKYIYKFIRNSNPSYYFQGNGLLDLIDFIFRLYFCSNSWRKDLIRFIQWNLGSWRLGKEREARLPDYQFKLVFGHFRSRLEQKLCFSCNPLSIFKLFGVPNDFQAFSFASDMLWNYTQGMTVRLNGIERRPFDKHSYKLHNISVARYLWKSVEKGETNGF